MLRNDVDPKARPPRRMLARGSCRSANSSSIRKFCTRPTSRSATGMAILHRDRMRGCVGDRSNRVPTGRVALYHLLRNAHVILMSKTSMGIEKFKVTKSSDLGPVVPSSQPRRR